MRLDVETLALLHGEEISNRQEFTIGSDLDSDEMVESEVLLTRRSRGSTVLPLGCGVHPHLIRLLRSGGIHQDDNLSAAAARAVVKTCG